ncbi:MAG: phage terminase large subunit [Oscillospiraceae bacterium]|nr:phage terminase large subunit [Oscillospiraceae bacterium]
MNAAAQCFELPPHLPEYDFKLTRKQTEFIGAGADEVLFGGAAGGGKTYAQILDAFKTALVFPRSKQLIIRRTYPELDKSIIRVALELYPPELYRYNKSDRVMRFFNGSLIDFGYCEQDTDIYRYQSAEYDVIRFDELTHFAEEQYLYFMSRLRGANVYPKQIKSATNPGGRGHKWVKARFIDPVPPMALNKTGIGSRLYIPATVHENLFLLEKDPKYVRRLENLPLSEKRAMLHGDWDIFEGQYFSEFRRELHVCKPFGIPDNWRKYRALDYGLDMLACYWIALDERGRAFVYRELYEPNIIASSAARQIMDMTPRSEKITVTFAPPDLFSRGQDTGKSVAEILTNYGVTLYKSDNRRVTGWLNLREWLAPSPDLNGDIKPGLVIFETCPNLIRTLPALSHDRNDPNDAAVQPHELTHAPDALRYFASGRPSPPSLNMESTQPLIEKLKIRKE